MNTGSPPFRLFVLALCRDCAATLPQFLSMLDLIDSDPRCSVYTIFGENGSYDGTRNILEAATAMNPRRKWLDTGFMAKIPERLARMAEGREALRLALPPPEPGDIVLVADPDLIFSPPLTVECLHAALEELNGADVIGVCSHSTPYFYDILALEIISGERNPALDRYKHQLSSHSMLVKLVRFPAKIVHHMRAVRRQRALGTGEGLRAVSAFNGLCVYRRCIYDTGSYVGDGIQCEHVNLNRALHRLYGGRVLVSRVLGVSAPQEHLESFKSMMVGRISKALRRYVRR